MRENKKSQSTFKRNINAVKTFEEYLSKQKRGRKLEEATPQDLQDFVCWGKRTLHKVSMYVAGVRTYYEYKADKHMFNAARELIGSLYSENYKLKKFMGVKNEYVELLAAAGIKTAKQMLDAGKTRQAREKLAQERSWRKKRVSHLKTYSSLLSCPTWRVFPVLRRFADGSTMTRDWTLWTRLQKRTRKRCGRCLQNTWKGRDSTAFPHYQKKPDQPFPWLSICLELFSTSNTRLANLYNLADSVCRAYSFMANALSESL